ncbi:hypothetical protein C8R47DRAFT_1123083 [Mycena vitilis]|nr:hypothetical protein C8R47DRAFT_1123083 [Mycena vitilis]
MALSSSTTETTTYMLEKYSRAYSPKKASGGSEWQHFTNPVLRLILDSKLSPDTPDSSMRLRIVWTMNGGAGVTQQDVVLEDLDLLAFSSLKDKSDSSPLKGVYRDTTFGLRYLHVQDSTDSQKVYRRFQVSFGAASVAQQLVNAIRDVCPCKTTEPPAGALERKKTLAAIPVPKPPIVPMPSVSERPAASSLVPGFQFQRTPTMINLPDAPRMSSPGFTFSSQPEPGPSPLPPSYDPMHVNHQAAPALKPLPSSFPDSSPPPSSADSVMMPPPPPPSQLPRANTNTNVGGVTAETMAAALRDATGLYDLPPAALERLVGDVVREDGFVGLLESVSSMWAMKAVTTGV